MKITNSSIECTTFTSKFTYIKLTALYCVVISFGNGKVIRDHHISPAMKQFHDVNIQPVFRCVMQIKVLSIDPLPSSCQTA